MTDTPAATLAPLRILSFDVEEYVCIEAAHEVVARTTWDDWPTRVVANVDNLLQLLSDTQRKATFFMLGYVAAKHRELAPRIAAEGHEIASHGFGHDRLHRLNPQTFRDDLLRSKQLLEAQTGQAVLGYRAPTFSVTRQTHWAVDVLLDTGFVYDSSIFPVTHPWYGIPEAPVTPFFVSTTTPTTTTPATPTATRSSMGRATALLEVPPLTWCWGKRNLAVAGGGYFRLLPGFFMQRGLQQAARQARPAVLYFHPWEFDPEQPRLPLSLSGRMRTYMGQRRALARLRQLASQPARWCTFREVLPELMEQAQQQACFALTNDR